MADLALTTDADPQTERISALFGPYWIDDLRAAKFYERQSLDDLRVQRTLDGGQTHETEQAATGFTADLDVLGMIFDREVPGDTGNKAHGVYINGSGDDFEYANYDIEAGAFSAVVSIETFFGGITGGNFTDQAFITKTRSGHLISGFSGFSAGVTVATGTYLSTDGGVTWNPIASPFTADHIQEVHGIACDTGDDDDGALIMFDAATGVLSIGVYDASGDAWTFTTIASGLATEVSVRRRQFHEQTRLSDGYAIVAAWTTLDSATADLKCWEIFIGSVASPTISALTNVLTDSPESCDCAVFIDQYTGDTYVSYNRGTAVNSLVAAKRKRLPFGSSTWDSEVAVQIDTEDDERIISSGAMGLNGGRLQEHWFNDDLFDIYYNLDTEVAFSPQRVRPTSTTAAGNWTAQPSGTLHANTADDDDVTTDELLAADSPNSMKLVFDTLEEPVSGDAVMTIRGKRA